jgi:AMP nucleosidase
MKSRVRTGTVFTTADRNWELRFSDHATALNQSRAIAVDMESATIAANGFRFRVPYGTLLCVSDKPAHGELKLGGVADSFYRERVRQHLMVGIETAAAPARGGRRPAAFAQAAQLSTSRLSTGPSNRASR